MMFFDMRPCFPFHCDFLAVALGQHASFYNALKADPAHKLIAQAVDADPKIKAMLQKPMSVTAFVPTDAVS
jgi:hypothetical protein